jgi:hypothetical protein
MPLDSGRTAPPHGGSLGYRFRLQVSLFLGTGHRIAGGGLPGGQCRRGEAVLISDRANRFGRRFLLYSGILYSGFLYSGFLGNR